MQDNVYAKLKAFCMQHIGCKFKKLELICSLGAGVDHLLSDPDIPKKIKITRIKKVSLLQTFFKFYNFFTSTTAIICILTTNYYQQIEYYIQW